jgi:hypothetical protein
MARLGTIPMLDAGPAFTLTDVSLVTSTFRWQPQFTHTIHR